MDNSTQFRMKDHEEGVNGEAHQQRRRQPFNLCILQVCMFSLRIKTPYSFCPGLCVYLYSCPRAFFAYSCNCLQKSKCSLSSGRVGRRRPFIVSCACLRTELFQQRVLSLLYLHNGSIVSYSVNVQRPPSRRRCERCLVISTPIINPSRCCPAQPCLPLPRPKG